MLISGGVTRNTIVYAGNDPVVINVENVFETRVPQTRAHRYVPGVGSSACTPSSRRVCTLILNKPISDTGVRGGGACIEIRRLLKRNRFGARHAAARDK